MSRARDAAEAGSADESGGAEPSWAAPVDIERVRAFFEAIPFNRLLGMHFEALGDGWARITLPYAEHLIGDMRRPALHGGVVSTLLDTVGGLALFTRVGARDTLSTVDLRVDYLRPGLTEAIVAEAKVLRIGNRVGVSDMKAYQTAGPDHPIAIGRGVYNIVRTE